MFVILKLSACESRSLLANVRHKYNESLSNHVVRQFDRYSMSAHVLSLLTNLNTPFTRKALNDYTAFYPGTM